MLLITRLRDLLVRVESDNVAALWDMHHPYRFANESPETTIQNLGVYIKYVHIKDSVMHEDGSVQYKIMGEGDMPIEQMIRALRSVNYEGYVSLEWVKYAAPDLQSAGIVFPHFANYMAQFFQGDMTSRRLQDNNRKTGKYVWPKNTLIDLTFPQANCNNWIYQAWR